MAIDFQSFIIPAIVGLITFISTFAVMQYRLSNLERKVADIDARLIKHVDNGVDVLQRVTRVEGNTDVCIERLTAIAENITQIRDIAVENKAKLDNK